MRLLAFPKHCGWPGALVVLQLCAYSAPLWAQQAPQITPRDLRPETTSRLVQSVPTPAPQQVPQNADALFVTLASATLEGSFPELATGDKALLAPLTGKRVSVADIYAVGAAIEAQYNDAGYPLVRVTVPPQQISDGGTLRMLVVDGFIEKIELTALPERTRGYVGKLLQSLIGKRHVREKDLERALVLAGRAPGLSLRSGLQAGSVNGGVVLVLEGSHTFVSSSLSADNRLSSALGPWQSNLQVGLNQPLAMGDQAYVYAASGADIGTAYRNTARRRVFGAGLSFPLGSHGIMLNAEYTASTSQPQSAPLAPATRSRFEKVSLRVSYPLILDRTQELSLTGAIDGTEQMDTLPDFAFTLSTERLRALRLGTTWRGPVLSLGQASFGATLSQGIAGLGATNPGDALAAGIPLSRVGSRPDFSKIEANGQFDMALPQGMQSKTTARWQKSLNGVLPGAELIGLDGEDALSSFTSGTISADGGWVVRQEISRPFVVEQGSTRAGLSPYLFAAAGSSTSNLQDAKSDRLITAIGAGLRSQWGRASLALEYGQGHLHSAASISTQFFAKVQVQF